MSLDVSNLTSALPSAYLPVPNSTKSFWHTDLHELNDHRSTEQLPEHSDIVIVGAGYAGVSTAYHLVKSQGNTQSVLILEARGACSGATGRNGGHVRPDLYGHIPKYIDRAGPEAAAEIAEFEIAHVHALKKIVEEESIDCDFTLTRTIDVWCNDESAKSAKRIYDKMVAHGGFEYLKDVMFYTGKDAVGISGVKDAVACATYTAGTMYPYKFILHLIKSILSTGRVNLQTHTPATSITEASDSGFIIDTPRGKVHTGKIIHATNAYVTSLLPEYERNIIPCKGICCRIAVPEGTTPPLLNNSYINRTPDNILSYLIPRTDGSIIVGGAAATFKSFREQWYNNVDDSVLIDAAKDYYTGYMQRTYRGWENADAKVEKIWTGVMGYSFDSHPHIGSVPNKDGQYILAGFNGHGMPVIWLAAQELAKMVGNGAEFEETSIPRLFKTTQERIDRARNAKEEDGDILGDTKIATEQ